MDSESGCANIASEQGQHAAQLNVSSAFRQLSFYSGNLVTQIAFFFYANVHLHYFSVG